MNKTHRHRLIAKLLASNEVKSQEHLRELLEAGGVRATQGTLSRDLRELGVVKAPAGYSLVVGAQNGRRASSDLEAAMSQFMLSCEAAGNVIVIKTEPGNASALAAQVDLSPPPGVLGTIAGDDTVFVAVRSPREARTISLHLQKLGGIL